MNTLSKILLFLLFCGTSFGFSNKTLEIYLMRDTVVNSKQVTLGMVSLVHGPKPLVESVSNIVLGKLSRAGQSMVIDRETIYARLASLGIDSSSVEFLGSMNARVSRPEVIISAQEIIKSAKESLADYFKQKHIAQAIASSRPSKVVVDGDKKGLDIKCSIENAGERSLTVRVDFLINGKSVDFRRVNFKLKYNSNIVVATHNILAGSVIGDDDFKSKKVLSNTPSSFVVSPNGKVARRRIAAGREIKPQMLTDVQQVAVVRKNQMVEIRYESAVLFVSALGEALSDGKAGEIIKVANVKVDDRGRSIKGRVIAARVLSDGSVVPAY